MPEKLPPESIVLSLQSLNGNSGWKAYCDRVQEVLEKEIDAKIFDPATPDDECRVLRRARKLLVDSYAPEKMRQGMVTVLETQIRQKRPS